MRGVEDLAAGIDGPEGARVQETVSSGHSSIASSPAVLSDSKSSSCAQTSDSVHSIKSAAANNYEPTGSDAESKGKANNTVAHSISHSEQAAAIRLCEEHDVSQTIASDIPTEVAHTVMIGGKEVVILSDNNSVFFD